MDTAGEYPLEADTRAVASESRAPTSSFVQEWDRDWSSLEKHIFGAYNVKILETPQSEERTGPNSFMCLPWTPWEVTCDVVARCSHVRPALIMAKASCDEDSPDLTTIGDLIDMLEHNLEYDGLAVRELLHAEESPQEDDHTHATPLPQCEDVPGVLDRPDCPCSSCR